MNFEKLSQSTLRKMMTPQRNLEGRRQWLACVNELVCIHSNRDRLRRLENLQQACHERLHGQVSFDPVSHSIRFQCLSACTKVVDAAQPSELFLVEMLVRRERQPSLYPRSGPTAS